MDQVTARVLVGACLLGDYRPVRSHPHWWHRLFDVVGIGMSFKEWNDMIDRANTPVPRTYQESYKAFLRAFPDVDALDKAAGFHAGWLAACDALANCLVEWLDEPAGDDVTAFLGFVEKLRKGDLA